MLQSLYMMWLLNLMYILHDPLTVDDVEAFEPVQKKPRLDIDTECDGMRLITNLSVIVLDLYKKPRPHKNRWLE